MSQRDTLSERQQRMLSAIRQFVQENGYPPSIRQLGELAGISSTSVVSYNLGILQRKGYIVRDPDVSRGLRLVEEADDSFSRADRVVSVPLLGVIAAGEPIPVPDSDFSQADYDAIDLARDLVPETGDVYALEVRGTSMIDALIDDGDIVLMRHQTNAHNGETVAAWLKDEKATTLKTLYWEQNGSVARLQPANPFMEPIYVHANDLEIQGRVIGVIRRLG
ncbi:MAG: repressor LexA [Anaerolineae bacterium]|nr:repressor LexA [Anaerolineae bacterium]